MVRIRRVVTMRLWWAMGVKVRGVSLMELLRVAEAGSLCPDRSGEGGSRMVKHTRMHVLLILRVVGLGLGNGWRCQLGSLSSFK